MKLETKFSLGQTVFFMAKNKVQSKQIQKINIEAVDTMCGEEVYVTYEVEGCSSRYYDNELFETKQQLLDSL